ncbi:AAA family ATPase [Streptomyces sioyaensis]|uniref:AAA family ATPase n=1 Tax=Streptomyces sioyaensis TaxID=67364 RepID=UPI003EB76771
MPEAGAAPSGPPQAPALAGHHGLLDLRGRTDTGPAPSSPFTMVYPANAVVVVSGLPGSGKSTLLRRTPAQATVIDPRAVHVACEAVMPGWLPYGLYRPWARWRHIRWLYRELRGDGPLLVHDCGSRPWVRRWMARAAGRRGRPLHLVLLDVGRAEALSGQESRGRRAPRRAFARHHRGLERLLRRLSEAAAAGPSPTPAPSPAAVRPAADGTAEVPAHRSPFLPAWRRPSRWSCSAARPGALRHGSSPGRPGPRGRPVAEPHASAPEHEPPSAPWVNRWHVALTRANLL